MTGREVNRLYAVLLLTIHLALYDFQTTPSAAPTVPNGVDTDESSTSLPKPDVNNLKGISYPYRVCSLSTHGDLFRFSAEYDCPSYSQEQQHEEGLLIVFKENIIPHTFPIRIYSKVVTTATVYSGYKYKAITNIYEESFPIENHEIDMLDQRYECFNSVKVNKGAGRQTYTDRDGDNATVILQIAPGLSSAVQRYQSQPYVYSDKGSIWTYRRRTTVNCMITDVLAKSNSPFNFFAAMTGQTIEMSPFFDGNNAEPFNERYSDFQIKYNHTIADFNDRNAEQPKHTRAFLHKPTYTVSWKLDRKDNYCPLTMWKSFSKAIKTDTGKSLHFLAPEATASFVTPTQNISLTEKIKCIKESIEKQIEEKIKEVQATHEKSTAEYKIYSATGGLILAWQPLIQKSLVSVKNLTDLVENEPATTPSPARRRRRDAGTVAAEDAEEREEDVKTIDSAAVLQIQFAYDRLKDQINQMLGDIARAWCLDQRRSNMILNELTKINPTTVMSSIYGVPVAAKRLGDIISVSKCINIDPASVSFQKSMLVPDNNGLCYSRPRVSFKFYNDTETYEGQLGTNNEILLTKNMIETCTDNAVHYFQSGSEIHVYSKYVHLKTINASDINTLQTFIALNASLIENIDFKALEIYTREERRMANVFDIESMLREYNYHTQNIIGMRKDLDNEISNNRNDFIDALGEILESLGGVGGVIANAVSVVAGLFGSLISGFISFFKNPFGGFLVLLAIGGIIVVVILIVMKTRRMSNSPVQMIYPAIDRIAQNKSPQEQVKPISKKDLDAIMLALYYHSQEQRANLQDQSSLTSWFKGKAEATKEDLKNTLNLRQRFSSGPKYQKLTTIDEEV